MRTLTALWSSILVLVHLFGVSLGSSWAPPGGHLSEQLCHVVLRDLTGGLGREEAQPP